MVFLIESAFMAKSERILMEMIFKYFVFSDWVLPQSLEALSSVQCDLEVWWAWRCGGRGRTVWLLTRHAGRSGPWKVRNCSTCLCRSIEMDYYAQFQALGARVPHRVKLVHSKNITNILLISVTIMCKVASLTEVWGHYQCLLDIFFKFWHFYQLWAALFSQNVHCVGEACPACFLWTCEGGRVASLPHHFSTYVSMNWV